MTSLACMYDPTTHSAMERFFTDMADMARPLMAPNGGPIILGQVENEFRWKDPDYIDWCGNLVKKTNTGIPFLMCNGYSASNTSMETMAVHTQKTMQRTSPGSRWPGLRMRGDSRSGIGSL